MGYSDGGELTKYRLKKTKRLNYLKRLEAELGEKEFKEEKKYKYVKGGLK